MLNHTGQSQEVTLHGRFTDLLDGERLLEGKATIGPLDVLVLEESDG